MAVVVVVDGGWVVDGVGWWSCWVWLLVMERLVCVLGVGGWWLVMLAVVVVSVVGGWWVVAVVELVGMVVGDGSGWLVPGGGGRC